MTQFRLAPLWPCSMCNAEHVTVRHGRLTFVYHASGIARIVAVEPASYTRPAR